MKLFPFHRTFPSPLPFHIPPLSAQSPESAWWYRALESLRLFERQVLVFPLLVVLLACTSFLFGGKCEAWQWWVAVAAVLSIPVFRRGNRIGALGAAGLFAGLLVILKGFLPAAFWDNAYGVDTSLYHFPMVQLLYEGWNPLEDPLTEEICVRLGLDLWGMAPTLVAFFSKTMAVFAAVSQTFTGDPTSATIPGLALLWLSSAFQVLRAYRGCARWVALAAMALVLPIMNRQIFVDEALAFAAFGLLVTMERDLRRRNCDWLHLGVYTIWMMNVKLNGVLAAFVFCLLFVLAKSYLARREWIRLSGKFVLFGAAVTISWGLISWNPLMTSWRSYGHPLYPFKTANKTKWPSQDPGWDMRVVNEDFRQMGRVGIWTYEYVSPRLVRTYYSWKTGRPDFDPQRAWIKEESYIHGWVRPALWGIFAVLLALRRGRMWGVAGLLLTFLVPWDKIGYTRYEPWLSALSCLALTLLADRVEGKWGRRAGHCIGWCAIVATTGALFVWGIRHARDVEFKAEECALVRSRIRCSFWDIDHEPADGVNPGDFVPRYDCLTAMENQCRLLAKHLGWTKNTQILPAYGWHPPSGSPFYRRPLWKFDERAWFAPDSEKDMRCVEDSGPPWRNAWDVFDSPSDAEPWLLAPWHRYWIPVSEHAEHVLAYHSVVFHRPGESFASRVGRRLRHATRVWGQVYPREVWKWLAGKKLERSSADGSFS